MGKEFKDIDINDSRKACEYAVDFAVDEEAALIRDNNKCAIFPDRLASMKNRYPELFDGSYKHLQPHTVEEWDEYDRRTQRDIADGQFCSFEEFTKEMKENLNIAVSW